MNKNTLNKIIDELYTKLDIKDKQIEELMLENGKLKQETNKDYTSVYMKGFKDGKEQLNNLVNNYKQKAVDKSCRNNGNCNWCKDNRLYKNRKREASLKGEGDND